MYYILNLLIDKSYVKMLLGATYFIINVPPGTANWNDNNLEYSTLQINLTLSLLVRLFFLKKLTANWSVKHYVCDTAAKEVASSSNNYLLKEQFVDKVFDRKIILFKIYNL